MPLTCSSKSFKYIQICANMFKAIHIPIELRWHRFNLSKLAQAARRRSKPPNISSTTFLHRSRHVGRPRGPQRPLQPIIPGGPDTKLEYLELLVRAGLTSDTFAKTVPRRQLTPGRGAAGNDWSVRCGFCECPELGRDTDQQFDLLDFHTRPSRNYWSTRPLRSAGPAKTHGFLLQGRGLLDRSGGPERPSAKPKTVREVSWGWSGCDLGFREGGEGSGAGLDGLRFVFFCRCRVSDRFSCDFSRLIYVFS